MNAALLPRTAGTWLGSTICMILHSNDATCGLARAKLTGMLQDGAGEGRDHAGMTAGMNQRMNHRCIPDIGRRFYLAFVGLKIGVQSTI